MRNQVYPCLWLDNQAKTAAEFYCSTFSNSKIIVESLLAVQVEIDGERILCMNGGPMFKINPSISMFVTCQTDEEIENLWQRLSDGGFALMPLDKYPWCEKYAWVSDKFGMTWQLFFGELARGQQKIIPLMLFVGEQFGKAEKAINTYLSIFKNSGTEYMELYGDGEPSPAGSLKFGRFSLADDQFAAMDGFGDHHFGFNEAVSLVVECETQEEIDYYWEKLSEDGSEDRCGWLRDKYGISWQIVPRILGQLMSDPEKARRVMQEILKMNKLDIRTMLDA